VKNEQVYIKSKRGHSISFNTVNGKTQ